VATRVAWAKALVTDWAAWYSYRRPNGKTYHPEWAFSWDGHGACWAGRMLNRTDAKYNSTKTYGAHQSVTEGGVTFQSDELWSAPLFQSMVALIAAGKPRANIDKDSSGSPLWLGREREDACYGDGHRDRGGQSVSFGPDLPKYFP